MAARNHEQYVADAAASVLEQDYDLLELIAVDDASDDATPNVLEHCSTAAPPGRMRFVRHERQEGIAETRANALSLARGEFIGLLDSDDLWLPGKLGPQVELLTAEPDVGLVHAEFEAFDSDTGKPIRNSHTHCRRIGVNRVSPVMRPSSFPPAATRGSRSPGLRPGA